MIKFESIKNQLLKQFFEEKKVKYDQENFIDFHKDIFPDANEFICFLSATGKDNMTKHAKNIVNRLLFDTPWNSLQSLYNNLLNLESSVLSQNDKTYIQQDHAIHSVNIYLLGLYLFFNYSVFNFSISEYFSNIKIKTEINFNTKQKSFLIFLNTWKSFALLHDIGYPFELAFNKTGEKNNVYNEFLKRFENFQVFYDYYESIKYLSSLIFINSIICFSKHNTLSHIENEIPNLICKTSGDKFNLDDTKRHYKKLEHISTNEDFAFFKSCIKNDTPVILVRDKSLDIICVFINDVEVYTNTIIQHEYYNFKSVNLISKQEKEKMGLTLEFYVSPTIEKEFSNILSSVNISTRFEEIQCVSNYLMNLFITDYTVLSKEISTKDLVYKISNELMRMCPLSFCELDNFSTAIPNEILYDNKKLFLNTILKSINNMTNNMLFDLPDIIDVNQINDTFDSLNKMNLEKLCENIKENYYNNKYNSNIINISCIELFQKIYNELDSGFKQYIISDKINIEDLVVFNRQSSLVDKVQELLVKENYLSDGECLDKVLEYKAPYSVLDHGICASLFLFNFIECKNNCEKNFEGQGIIRIKKYEMFSEDVFAQIIYAILVHNIYTDIYKEQCMNSPNNNILINPLSFLGMFCDNLQVWDRNKSLNQGLVKWDGYTLYGEDISIEFSENKIQILCKTSDIKQSFAKLKDKLKEYLPASDKMITLGLIEY